ncbi:hypothetical protein ALQ20_200063 [Pseudomonas syringae pv. atrofaciens]|nr:hypothetical protein ALQ20_200063 [Pseudomonas syringae pv. atrofaciens]
MLDLHRAAFAVAHGPVRDDELAKDVQGWQVHANDTARPTVVAPEVHRQADRTASPALAHSDVRQALRLIRVGHIRERHRLCSFAAVLKNPFGNADLWVIRLGPGLFRIDERAAHRVDGRIVGRLGAAGHGADDHVFGDLEVIRTVIGTSLEHPAAADANQLAGARRFQLLQYARALLVGTDHAGGTIALADRAVGIGNGLVAHVGCAGERFKNDLIVRHVAAVA